MDYKPEVSNKQLVCTTSSGEKFTFNFDILKNYQKPNITNALAHMVEPDGSVFVCKNALPSLRPVNNYNIYYSCQLCEKPLGNRFGEGVTENFRNRNLSSCNCFCRFATQMEFDRWQYNMKYTNGDRYFLNSVNAEVYKTINGL